jgi:hypothetical protein
MVRKHWWDDERAAGIENGRLGATVSTTIPRQNLLLPKQEEMNVHRLLDDFCYSNRQIWRSISTGSGAILDVSNGLPDGGMRSTVTHVLI